MMLFIVHCKVVLTFESVDECVTIQMKATEQYFCCSAVQGGSNL